MDLSFFKREEFPEKNFGPKISDSNNVLLMPTAAAFCGTHGTSSLSLVTLSAFLRCCSTRSFSHRGGLQIVWWGEVSSTFTEHMCHGQKSFFLGMVTHPTFNRETLECHGYINHYKPLYYWVNDRTIPYELIDPLSPTC